MNDESILVSLEFHGHPEGEWCDEARCYQRAEQERKHPGSTARAYATTEPEGEILAFGERRDNAQLMLDCARLGYLPEPVLDATYGKGRFWRSFRPVELTTNDLDLTCDTMHHLDFRQFPAEWGRGFGAAVFDGPYKLNGTSTGKGPSALDEGYGVGGEYVTVADKMKLLIDGARECARVADKFLIVKCQDQVVSGAVVWQTHWLTNFVTNGGIQDAAWNLVDMLHVRGYRPQPPGRRQLHARRDYSSALIFERKR